MLDINTKKCCKCQTIKPYTEFHKNKTKNDGAQDECKECRTEYMVSRVRTKEGLVLRIYNSQIGSSRLRNHVMPNYTALELREWAFSQPIFHELYDAWNKSGYSKMIVPSLDRLDDYKPYTLDNIQITTWLKNKEKYYADVKNGINNKATVSVVQMNLKGLFIAEHCSISHAGRVNRMCSGHIPACCSGKRKSAGGFWWMRSLGIPIHNNMPRLVAGTT